MRLPETVLTAVLVCIFLSVTSTTAPKGPAPLAIGLTLTLSHLVSIPVSNTSVNPARSLGAAWFAGGEHPAQVWVFFVVPTLGAVIAGVADKLLIGDRESDLNAETQRRAEVGWG